LKLKSELIVKEDRILDESIREVKNEAEVWVVSAMLHVDMGGVSPGLPAAMWRRLLGI
jgi:hypothetical protein